MQLLQLLLVFNQAPSGFESRDSIDGTNGMSHFILRGLGFKLSKLWVSVIFNAH
jgi:hypothetical protein